MIRKHICIVGTRPEAIKMAPVVKALHAIDGDERPVLVLTGQHPSIAAEALAAFGLKADANLECVRPGGDLCSSAAGVIDAVGRLIDDQQPASIIVQGDTLSASAAAFAGVLRRVPVGHVEAGLRSGDPDDPFPEERSRRLIGQLARWHFAPTEAAANNLRNEGVDASSIHIVGNTVIDALRLMESRLKPVDRQAGRRIVVTTHRRENWGPPLQRICCAIHMLSDRHADWRFIFSVHPNPMHQRVVGDILARRPQVQRMTSPPYDTWMRELMACDLILTDSGGMQEEACGLGKPVLVLRETTERPEAVRAGNALVIGTHQRAIVANCERILNDEDVYARMAQRRDVFGDGRAGAKIAAILTGGRDAMPMQSTKTNGAFLIGDQSVSIGDQVARIVDCTSAARRATP